jgi:hypothetical protein
VLDNWYASYLDSLLLGRMKTGLKGWGKEQVVVLPIQLLYKQVNTQFCEHQENHNRGRNRSL